MLQSEEHNLFNNPLTRTNTNDLCRLEDCIDFINSNTKKVDELITNLSAKRKSMYTLDTLMFRFSYKISELDFYIRLINELDRIMLQLGKAKSTTGACR